MQKINYTYGENEVYTGQNISGDGTSSNPLGYSGGVEHVDPRTLLWETSGNMYNQNFRLSEPATHFDKLMIYSSGAEYVDRGVNLGKNVYKTQNTRMGCDACGYSSWRLDFSANYMLGCDIKIEGDSGHVGSAYYIGIGSNNATYAAGKWVGDNAQKMLQPYKIYGLDHKPWHTVTVLEAENGSASASLNSGCEYDKVTLTSTPDEGWYSMGYNVSGATLSGNQLMIEDDDVTVQPLFTDQSFPITYTSDGHGTVSGNKSFTFPTDTVTLTNTPNNGYKLDKYYINGVGQTSNTFSMPAQDTTVSGAFIKTSGQLYGNSGSNTPGNGYSNWVPDTSTPSGNYIALKFTFRRGRNYLHTNNWTGPIIRANGADKMYSQGRYSEYKYRVFMNSGSNFKFNRTASQSYVEDGGRNVYLNGTSWGSDAVGKIIFQRSNGATSAFLNGTYWGNQALGAKITSVGLRCNNNTDGGTTQWIGSKFYLAWFDNFNDAKNY